MEADLLLRFVGSLGPDDVSRLVRQGRESVERRSSAETRGRKRMPLTIIWADELEKECDRLCLREQRRLQRQDHQLSSSSSSHRGGGGSCHSSASSSLLASLHQRIPQLLRGVVARTNSTDTIDTDLHDDEEEFYDDDDEEEIELPPTPPPPPRRKRIPPTSLRLAMPFAFGREDGGSDESSSPKGGASLPPKRPVRQLSLRQVC